MERYFVIYKPYKMLSQFVRMPKKRCLADLDFDFPEGVNALGRLDENSEGLLILSNDKKLNQLLLKPENEHKRVYWVQVQFKVQPAELKTLEEGMKIRLEKGDYMTRPCQARIIAPPEQLPPRERRPVRTDLETEWLELILTEGKFHQVRKMCAGVGHQVLRLLRVSIEDLALESMKPGWVRELSRQDIFSKLRIPDPGKQQ
jgi:23S rRNA pseudouridine2457 synthase